MKTATTLPAAICEWLKPFANHFDVTPNMLHGTYLHLVSF